MNQSACKKVLVVDDDATIVRVLSLRFKHLGFEVRTAHDGMAAVTLIGQDPPDLILLDVNMPSGSGLSVCGLLADEATLAEIPVIILTGRSDDHTIKRCEELGAYFVSKGIDAWNQIEPLIQKLFGNSQHCNEAQNSEPTDETPESPSPPKVLCIDDDPAISKAMKIRLGAYGIEVVRSFNGTQGYRTALKEAPDVIITDFQMPDGQGNFVLGRLKSHPLTDGIPVIILTGRSIDGRKDFALERELLSLGATRYLTKPLDFDALLTELRKHISIPQRPIKSPSRLPV